MSKLFYLTSHQAHLQMTTGGAHSTRIVYSINDKKRIAWYQFLETNRAFSVGAERDLLTGQKNTGSHFVLGQPTKSVPFQPIYDIKVDQFAIGDTPDFTRARAFVQFANNRITYGIKVYLKSGAEWLDCEFSSPKPAFGVDEWETGSVYLQKVAKYSSSALSSRSSLLPGWGTKTDDPVLIIHDE